MNEPSVNAARPAVQCILETALYVKDPAIATAFYQRIFGFEILSSSERLIALNVAGRSVLLLFKVGSTEQAFSTPGGIIPGHCCTGQNHFAFAIAAGDVGRWNDYLKSQGVAIESVVDWGGGPQSLYFRDSDAHLVELITSGFWKLQSA